MGQGALIRLHLFKKSLPPKDVMIKQIQGKADEMLDALGSGEQALKLDYCMHSPSLVGAKHNTHLSTPCILPSWTHLQHSKGA
jgi:hypothetical protein